MGNKEPKNAVEHMLYNNPAETIDKLVEGELLSNFSLKELLELLSKSKEKPQKIRCE